MSVPRPHSLWLAELRREGSLPLVIPLTLPAPFGVGRSAASIEADLKIAIEEAWMEDGRYLELLSQAPLLEPEVIWLDVVLPPHADHPEQNLSLPAVASRVISGHAVILPSLGLDAWGPDKASAVEAAREAVKTDVARKNRRASARSLAEMTWWTHLALHEVQPELHWYTFHERRERALAKERQQKRQLHRAASVLPPAVAYESEDLRKDLRRALQARVSAGVLVVGPQSSGKTALIADEASKPNSAFHLFSRGEARPVWSTTAARLGHVLTAGGSWQSALSQLCDELVRERVWLHVASLAELFEVGRYEGNETSIAEYLKPWLGRAEIAIISECTPEELAVLEARYPGYLEHFARVIVPAPEPPRLARIVAQVAREIGSVEPAAGDEIIRLQRRFMPYSGFPGRTIRFMRALAGSTPPPLRRINVTERFCEESGIPRAFIDPDEPLPHSELQERFSRALFGQPGALAALVDVATAIKADVAPRGRPITALLFTGPTGVGKTEAARALASVLFGARDRMVRFDMSEFATPASVLSLTTSPDPYGEGRLTGAVRRQPFCVLLLDEVEKAHPDLFDLLLPVLGEGRLTDHRGRVADFCSAVIVMTTNLGAELAMRARVGMARSEDTSSELKDAIHRALRPELIGRLDRIVPFLPLSHEALLRVLDREIDALARHPALADRSAQISVSAPAREHLAEKGYDPARGARPLQRVLREELVRPLSIALDEAPTANAPKIEVDLQDGTLVVRFTPRPPEIARPTMIEAITSARRELQAVIRGETFAEHAAAVQLAERQARAAAASGRHRQIDIQALYDAPAPLDALKGLLSEALALEAKALSSQLRLRKEDPEERAHDRVALEDIDRRRVTHEHTLYHLVHQAWEIAYLGLWMPSEQRPSFLSSFLGELLSCAEHLGIEVHQREVWSLTTGALRDVDISAPKPQHANRWAGFELWLQGPGAVLLVDGLAGLYAVPLPNKETVRCLAVVASPRTQAIPSCCERQQVGLELIAKPHATGPCYVRLLPPRPEDVLRKSTYDGRAIAWPPIEPSPMRFRRLVREHLSKADPLFVPRDLP